MRSSPRSLPPTPCNATIDSVYSSLIGVPMYVYKSGYPKPPPIGDAPQSLELGNEAKKRAHDDGRSDTILSIHEARKAMIEADKTGDKNRKAQAKANFEKAQKHLSESHAEWASPAKKIKPAETDLKNKLSEINSFLSAKKVNIQFGHHMQGSVNAGVSSSSTPHASYGFGEDRKQRVQDYLSIGLKKFLDEKETAYGNKIKEIQMSAFGLKDGKYSKLIISGNNDRDNKKITDAARKFIDKKESDIASHDGAWIFNDFNLLGFSEYIAAAVKSTTASTKANEDLIRRMDKLNARSSDIFGQSVTLYIPKADKHAEQVVLDHLKRLNVADDDRLPISGSKLPCVGCASELNDNGVRVQYATNIYNSAMPEKDKLLKLIESGTQFGNEYMHPTNRKNIYRRHSVSPAPKK
jgi:hypothetical protein